MKKALIVILILVLLSFTYPGQRVLFSIQWWDLSTFQGRDGLYSSTLREYRCSNPRACKHEEGHKEDHLLNWYSETQEFEDFMEVLADCGLAPELSQLPYIQFWIRSDSKIEHELYANIYAAVDLDGYGSLKDLLTDYVEECKND